MGDREVEAARQNSIKLTKKIQDRAGERETLHRKTFTKWVNAKLAQHDPPLEIKDIVIDLMDGKMLLNLLECLLNCQLTKEKGNMRVHKLNNVEKAMDLLEKHKVKLVGINGFDIVDGKPRAILGLMWSIILRFQVQEVMQETVTEETAKSFNVEKKLLDWCKERLKGYEDYVTISDFTSSWRNGLAFNALIHSYRPELFDFDAQKGSSIRERLDNSFKIAEKHFGVPRYLESSDIDVDNPDKKLIIMYLTELYNYLEGNKAKERKASTVKELTVAIDSLEAVEGALNDSFDQLDSKPAISKAERDKAVAQLNKNLNEVESGLSDAEHRKPVFNEKDSVDLETATKQLQEQRKFREDLEPLKSRTYEVLNEGRAMIGEGYFDKGEEEHFQDRMNNVDKRMQNLLEHSQRDQEKIINTLEDTKELSLQENTLKITLSAYVNLRETAQEKLALGRSVLLKQQLARMNSWLTKAERKMKQGNSLGPNYEAVKKKLEDHQKLQEEVGDISLVASVLAIDLSDPDLDGKTRDKVKDVSSRWAKAWNWSEDRGQKLTKAMIDWQKFRDEELTLLNWLSQKEKTLKQVASTDVADEEQVKESLELLETTQKELDEQEMRLQKLRQLGEDLIEESDHDKETTKDIKAQLQDFDDCWNQVAKRIIDEKEKLINAQNKMKEMYDLMDSVNVWIDDGQGMMKEHKEDISDEENENLKKRAQIKLEERPSMQLKVDRVNRLGKDVCNILDGPSEKAVKGELQEFNDRWRDLTAAMESYNDKGYRDANGNECCLMRIIKRKFKTFS